MDELKKNQIFTAEIESYSSEAYGVCRVNGRAVFVPRALVGETWQIRIVKVSSSAVYARAEELLSPSPERMVPACPFFGKCGGCDCWHMKYSEELRFKLGRVNNALQRIGKQSVLADEILPCDSPERYRNKGIFTLAETEGKAVSGFFRERSHELIPVDRCLIQNEISERAAKAVAGFLNKYGILPYNEENGRGTVRHVFCRRALKSKDAVVCIISAKGFGELTNALIEQLLQACPELTGIVLNINKSRGNTVLTGDFYTLWGKPEIVDELCGFKFRIAPQAFFQINPPQAEKLYSLALAFAGSGRLALDLYCGAGTISLCLSRSFNRVIGAEIVPEAIENAKANAMSNEVENTEFICGDATVAARKLADNDLNPDVVVVDPPRKGMSEKAIHAVCSMAPDRIVYVSCNPATLARDLLLFSELGYILHKAVAVDMFPRTSHVETVCCLYRLKIGSISVAHRDDWKTKPMPKQHESFVLKRSFSDEEMAVLRCGNIPQTMEDKWFWYMEKSSLWAHRSWTGYCIYRIDFKTDNNHLVTVNRNSNQYKCTSIEKDLETLNKLLDWWTRNPYDHYNEWISERHDSLENARKNEPANNASEQTI